MALLRFLEGLGRFSHFAARSLVAAMLAVLRPGDFAQQLSAVLLGALPLAAVAGFAFGGVVWLHLHSVLGRFDAGQYLPQALALAVVLEFAPTGAGLIAAGR